MGKPMTKPSDTPSKWTPQEAWDESAKAHLIDAGLAADMILPFPPDPAERVSDAVLAVILEQSNLGTNTHSMALELIERRKAEKEGKG